MIDRTASLATAALTLLAALATAPPPAAAQGACGGTTPAYGADSSLWGSLRPTDTGRVPAPRDSTDYSGRIRPDWHYPLFSSLDIDGDRIYTTYSSGFQVWDISTAAARRDPVKLAERDGWRFDFPVWDSGNSHTDEWLWDVDAPDGGARVMAIGGISPAGLSVWDTAVATAPEAVYQDTGRSIYQLYTARLGGRDYVFAGAEQSSGNGLHVYDLTASLAQPGLCTENSIARIDCPGVYLGRLGPAESVSYVDGAPIPGGRHLLAWSSAVSVRGMALWDVTNPFAPVNLRSGGGRFLDGQIVYGVSLWSHGDATYLALVRAAGAQQVGEIYDLTPCLGGGCTTLAGRLVWSRPIAVSAVRFFVTDSSSDGRPMLYFGNENMCSGGLRREWLYDVSNPAAPVEEGVGPVVDQPNPGGSPNPYPVDYWSWYYAKSPTGFSLVMPRMGKFSGPYFYRAAWTLFDIHQRIGGPAPEAIFADGFESGDLTAWSAAAP